MPQYKKLVIVGDGGIGKTSLLHVFANNVFSEDHLPTVFDNKISEIFIHGKWYDLALWDTAGQEDFYCLRTMSYPDTDVILLCYSVDKPTSLENITKKWKPEIDHYMPNVPIILVANKIDLRNNAAAITDLARTFQVPVSEENGKAVAQQINAKAFRECSAKEGEGVHDVFKTAVKATIHNKCVMQ